MREFQIDGKPANHVALAAGQSIGLAMAGTLSWRERLTGRVQATTMRLTVDRLCIEEGHPHVHLQINQPDPEQHMRGTRAAL